MSDPAPERTSADLSLNGLEQIFVQAEPVNTDEFSATNANIHEHSAPDAECSFELITMAEAARRMKMPYPTLRRQVLSGKIPSAPGSDGKPLVKMAKSEHSQSQSEHATNANESSTNINEHSPVISEFSATIQRLFDQLETERDCIQALTAKLEAASHRNGYLEAQLAAKDEHIKLLTDSQHKSGLLSRLLGLFRR